VRVVAATAEAIVAAREELTREQMIPLLQEIQASEGYLSTAALTLVADALDTPVSRVYGVVTFYNQFRLAPLGGARRRGLPRSRRATSSRASPSPSTLKRRLKLRDDGNSADGRYTVVSVACWAPVRSRGDKLDGEFLGRLTQDKLDALLTRSSRGRAAEGRSREGRGEAAA